MSNINPYSKHRRIIQDVLDKQQKNTQKIFKSTKFSFKQHSSSFINKFRSVELEFTPVYYDLYKFLGITYSGGGDTSPVPESAYIEQNSNEWYFKYPIIGFPVLAGATPESVTDGAETWEFQVTVAVIKSVTQFDKMPDWAIEGAKHVSYLYKTDGTPYTSSKEILQAKSTDLDEISVDFNNFHRWVKLTNGYNFEFYAIYPLTSTEIKLNTTLYFTNTKNTNYAKSEKI